MKQLWNGDMEVYWKMDISGRTQWMLEHTTTRLYVKCHGLTSEQGDEGTVYIDKNITLVDGDSKRIRLSYKYVNQGLYTKEIGRAHV